MKIKLTEKQIKMLSYLREQTPDTEENVEVNTEEKVLQQEEVKEEESNTVNFENLDSMSVKELQEICRENKLKIKGRKDELIDRIKEHLSLSKL